MRASMAFGADVALVFVGGGVEASAWSAARTKEQSPTKGRRGEAFILLVKLRRGVIANKQNCAEAGGAAMAITKIFLADFSNPATKVRESYGTS
jgi:hypothetical protein